MSPLLLLLWHASSQSSVSVVPDPAAQVATFQLIVRTGDKGIRNEQIARLLGLAVIRQTEDFGPGTIRRIVSGGGELPSIAIAPDHLRIRFSVPSSDTRLGLALLASMVQRPSLSDSDIAEAKNAAGTGSRSMWSTGTPYSVQSFADLRPDTIRLAFRNWFRPERIGIAISGYLGGLDPTIEWTRRTTDWRPNRTASWPYDALTRPTQRSDVPVLGSFEMPLGSLGLDAVAESILATFALGVGKTATAFRVLRTRLGISYRQESIVVPTESGLRFVFRWFAGGQQVDRESVRKAVLDDVESWSDSERKMAVEMARGVFLRRLPWPVLWLDDLEPLGSDAASRGYLAAYWRLKTDYDWDPRELLAAMERVALDRLKAVARRWISEKP